MGRTSPKSRRFLENGLPFCIFIIITLICFWEYVFAGNVPMSRDDALNYQVGRKYVTGSIMDGHLPMWCPLVGLGYPMPAEGQVGLAQPFHFLFFLLPFLYAYTLSILICYPLFAFFLYRLGRTWGLEREGALLCAVAVTFAGAYLLWELGYPIIATLLWYPLVLMYLIKACRGENRMRNIALASVFYALMIFSGNFQFVYGATVFTIFFLLLAGDYRKGFPPLIVLRNIFPALIAGALLGALQLVPQYELAMLSERAGSVFDTAMGSLNWNELLSLGAPILYNPVDPVWPHGYAIFGYIGFLGTLLAIVGIASSRPKINALVLIVICITLGFGGFTTLGLFRMASRMLFFLGLLLGMYAGYGYDALLHAGRGEVSMPRAAAIAGAVVIVLALLAGSYYNVNTSGEFLRLLLPQVIVIAVAFLVLKFKGKRTGAVTAGVIFVALAGSVFVHDVLNTSNAVKLEAVSRTPEVITQLKPRVDSGRIWISLMRDNRDSRLFHLGAVGPRATLYGLATPDHETPLYIDGVVRFQRRMIDSFALPGLGRQAKADARADILAGLQYIAVEPDAAGNLRYPEVYRDIESEPPFSILRMTGFKGLAFFIFPRAVEFAPGDGLEPQIDGFVFDEDGRVRSLLLDGPERDIHSSPAPAHANVIEPFGHPNRWRIEYAAPQGSFLFISQINYPGWRAYINGRPVHLYGAYGLFCGVVVDEPEGVVELIYQPLSWKVGAVLSLVGLLIMTVMLLSGRLIEHNQSKE